MEQAINRRDVKIRLALDEEGPRVAELAAEVGFKFSDWDIDWSHIHPHWLVAEYLGELLGCLQVCYGRPVGRLEIMGIDARLGNPTRALVVKQLLLSGCQILKDYGAHAASGVVPFKLGWYKRFLKRRGAVVISSGNLFLYRW